MEIFGSCFLRQFGQAVRAVFLPLLTRAHANTAATLNLTEKANVPKHTYGPNQGNKGVIFAVEPLPN